MPNLLPLVAAALLPQQPAPAPEAAPPTTAAAPAAVPAPIPQFHPAERLEATGGPIEAVTGHAAPFFVDLTGDGKRDLVVGMFGNDGGASGGSGRLYANVGTDTAPRFAGHEPFRSGDALALMESS